MTSVLTIGSSVYSIMPFMLPSAAFLKALFTSSAVVGFLTTQTKSVIEPLGVGTRRACPFSLQSNSGITFVAAFAAPVVVGTMFKAAERPLLGSLWGASTSFWSAV